MTTIQDIKQTALEEFDKKFTDYIKNISVGQYAPNSPVNIGYKQANEVIKDFISTQLDRLEEEVRSEDRMEIENYFGHILNDGDGKPMNMSIEEIGRDLIKLLSINSKEK